MRITAAVLAALLLLAGRAEAQFFKVYPWETPPRGWAEPALWTTWVASSDAPYTSFGGSGSREGLVAHSVEMEYGVSDRLAVAAYVDFENAPDGGAFRYTRSRLEARYRLFDKYQMLFDPALYVEYYFPRESFGEPDELEVRLILQRDLGDLRLLLNPTLGKAMSGDEVQEGVEGELSSGIYYRRSYFIQPGIEYYANVGPLRNPSPRDEQRHRIFPTATIRAGRGFRWELGVGFGLNDASDRVLFKSMLSYEFMTLRPSKQAR